MIIMVISIMMSLPCWKKFVTSCTLSCSLARMIPMISANTMICSMFPAASASIGFLGMMSSSVSAKPALSVTVVSTACTWDISSPKPGLSSEATPSETATASMVVTR